MWVKGRTLHDPPSKGTPGGKEKCISIEKGGIDGFFVQNGMFLEWRTELCEVNAVMKFRQKNGVYEELDCLNVPLEVAMAEVCIVE